MGRPFGAPCARRNLRPDQALHDDARLREHAQPGRVDLPAALGDERRQSSDRAASRLARCRAAPPRRGRDGGGPPARRGRDLLARSRHRLGRGRSGHQRGRAEGRLAPSAAHRPRQSPHGRALARRAGAGQPLRGAGMPGGYRCGRRECAGYAAAAHRRARRAGAACARLRLRRAVRRGRALRGGEDRRTLCGPHPRRLRRDDRFRRDRRLCAEILRALRQDQANERRQVAHRAPARRADVPHERRHHRGSRHAQSAARALARREGDPARRAAARPGRGVFHRDTHPRRHLRVRRRGV